MQQSQGVTNKVFHSFQIFSFGYYSYYYTELVIDKTTVLVIWETSEAFISCILSLLFITIFLVSYDTILLLFSSRPSSYSVADFSWVSFSIMFKLRTCFFWSLSILPLSENWAPHKLISKSYTYPSYEFHIRKYNDLLNICCGLPYSLTCM
jgi:hypothetical protein